MNRTIKRIAVAAALSLPMALVGQAAHAAFITQWGYDVQTGFADWSQTSHASPGTGTGVIGSNPNANLNNDPTTLSWGSDTQRSSLVVTGSVTGSDLYTNGASVTGATVTHNNFVIPGDSLYLDTAQLENKVTLTPIAPPGSSLLPFSTTFSIQFDETPNVSGTCATGSGSVCDDIFVLTNPGEQSQTFTLDGVTYTALLTIHGIVDLPADACAAANAAPGCQGVMTLEDQSNNITADFRIVAAQAVPEPGALSIMGLGLVGLALAGIRRNRKKS